MSTPALLVIHPPSPARQLLLDTAVRVGFAVHACEAGLEGLAAFRQRSPDILIASLDLPDVEGLSLVTSVREEAPDLSMVLVTARASVESAVAAIRLGVHDYLREPLEAEKLRGLLADRFDEALRRRVRLFPAERSAGVSFHGMIGRSVPMRRLFRMLRNVAPHVRTALISGETGTGKELVARALHQLGARVDRRFVVINCSAVVETLFESELFGHVRGAFTGATDSKPGLFELADGGTLFLDEVGELPTGVQAKLLRTIEFGEVHRVGSLEPRKVDVQIVAATNRDLEAEGDAGRFRRDLFYRLNVIDIRVPPLRDRRDDIVYLANAFMRATAARLAKPLTGLTSGADRLLRADRMLREQRASELEARHARLIEALSRLRIETTAHVEAALDLVAFRNDVWREHSHRVRHLAVALAATLRLPASQVEVLGQAALLHELGRLVLPDGLLGKTGELTSEERALWRRVPDLGASILEPLAGLHPVAGIIRSRFEEYAGSGYPRQLAGDEIPMTSRVLAVADSYDAMRSPRPFRDALTHEQAVGELVRGSSTQFDPDVVRSFTRLPGLGDCRG